MLDDVNVLKQRDPSGALDVAAALYSQAGYDGEVLNTDHDDREIKNIVVAGMGGSALAADTIKVLLATELPIPLEVVKGYDLPTYADHDSLVIASSHSGNTEETVSCLYQALERGCQIAVMTTGGKLADIARDHNILTGLIPHDTQPRMAVIYGMRTLLKILIEFGLTSNTLHDEVAEAESWLQQESALWGSNVPTEHNYAK
ncbi:MAG: SIS domain-containing protein, partial [Candidatus Saccharimonas sp.]